MTNKYIEREPRFTGYLLLHEALIDNRKDPYKGIDRQIPEFSQEENKKKLWLRMANAGWKDERSLFIKGLQDAQLLFEEYSELGVKLDLIEVNLVENKKQEKRIISKKDGVYLGYDVATWAGYSAIWDRPVAWDEKQPSCSAGKNEQIAWPLWKLQGQYFGSKLNKYYLLQTWEQANLFLNVEKTLGFLFPEFYEYDVKQLQVFSIHLLESTINNCDIKE